MDLPIFPGTVYHGIKISILVRFVTENPCASGELPHFYPCGVLPYGVPQGTIESSHAARARGNKHTPPSLIFFLLRAPVGAIELPISRAPARLQNGKRKRWGWGCFVYHGSATADLRLSPRGYYRSPLEELNKLSWALGGHDEQHGWANYTSRGGAAAYIKEQAPQPGLWAGTMMISDSPTAFRRRR
jgi:hypothetical protein